MNSNNPVDYDPSSETNVENLVKLIQEQTKEIKINKRRLEKLEEKYVKVNSDLKNVLNDKTNIENFLKTIFPKDMHENIVKTDYGLYDSAELSKLYIVVEAKNQNEFQKILSTLKNENSDLMDKLKASRIDAENKAQELNNIKKTHNQNVEQLGFYSSSYTDLTKKNEELENEKMYLMKMLDEKNSEIENLIALEIENAELKAKTLLENLDNNNTKNLTTSSNTNNDIARKSNFLENDLEKQKSQEKTIKIGKKYFELIV